MPKTKTARVRDDLPSYISDDPKKLAAKLRRALNPTHPDWKGYPLKIVSESGKAEVGDGDFDDDDEDDDELTGSVFGTKAAWREKVNVVGKLYGCHECLTVVEMDEDQPWIGDHIPSTKLGARARAALGAPDETVLLPSCQNCSSTQAALVKVLNATKDLDGFWKTLTSRQQALVIGGKSTQGKVLSHSPKVSKAERAIIKKNGMIDGCHACGGKVPRTKYIADHCPPQEFLTWYMPELCKELKIEIPEPTILPHCPKCSSEQGGRGSQITKVATKLAKKMGIPVYK